MSQNVVDMTASGHAVPRRPYPGAGRTIIASSLVLSGLVGVAGFGVSLYLAFKVEAIGASIVVGVVSVLLAGALGASRMHRRLALAPCPRCGAVDLASRRSHDSRLLRVCEHCDIAWDMGVGDEP